MDKIVWLNIASGGCVLLSTPAAVAWTVFLNNPGFDWISWIDEFRISCSVFSLLGITLSCFLQYQANVGMTPSQVKKLFKIYAVTLLILILTGMILIILFDVFFAVFVVSGIMPFTDKDLMIAMNVFHYIWASGAGSFTSLISLPVWFLSYHIAETVSSTSPAMSQERSQEGYVKIDDVKERVRSVQVSEA